jgi:cytochrome c oxidase subunit IV
MAEHGGERQQHPLSMYLWVWGWLFVLSIGSYLVDISALDIYIKWTLITLFMFAKAGLIMAVFMHMMWERLSLVTAITVPPGVLLVAMLILALETQSIISSRLAYFFQ